MHFSNINITGSNDDNKTMMLIIVILQQLNDGDVGINGNDNINRNNKCNQKHPYINYHILHLTNDFQSTVHSLTTNIPKQPAYK